MGTKFLFIVFVVAGLWFKLAASSVRPIVETNYGKITRKLTCEKQT